MRSLTTFLALIMCTASFANEGRPVGHSCDLTAPPEVAGETMSHGLTIYIFPRAKDITPTYSGCQGMWGKDSESWVLISLTEIENGDPVRMWSAHEKNPKRCIYKLGKVIEGDEANCPMARFLIKKSMDPGCAEKTRKAAQSDAVRPLECKFE